MRPAVAPVTALTPARQALQKESPPAELLEDGPYELTAILELDGQPVAGIFDPATGRSGLVRVGGSFGDGILTSLDAVRQTADFCVGEKTFRMMLKRSEAGRIPAAAGSPPAVAPSAPTVNLPLQSRIEGYVPTLEEKQRGIDPNEPSTWPDDYRGPAIERALRGEKVDPSEE